MLSVKDERNLIANCEKSYFSGGWFLFFHLDKFPPFAYTAFGSRMVEKVFCTIWIENYIILVLGHIPQREIFKTFKYFAFVCFFLYPAPENSLYLQFAEVCCWTHTISILFEYPNVFLKLNLKDFQNCNFFYKSYPKHWLALYLSKTFLFCLLLNSHGLKDLLLFWQLDWLSPNVPLERRKTWRKSLDNIFKKKNIIWKRFLDL